MKSLFTSVVVVLAVACGSPVVDFPIDRQPSVPGSSASDAGADSSADGVDQVTGNTSDAGAALYGDSSLPSCSP